MSCDAMECDADVANCTINANEYNTTRRYKLHIPCRSKAGPIQRCLSRLGPNTFQTAAGHDAVETQWFRNRGDQWPGSCGIGFCDALSVRPSFEARQSLITPCISQEIIS